MKQKIRLTEGDLHRIIRRCVNEALDNNANSWYNEEDNFGNTGQPGQVRSYDLGNGWYISNLELQAQEHGTSLEEDLEDWFHEVNDGTMPFTWETLGSGYGYHGNTICTFKNQLTGGQVVFKEIYDQVMCDEYAPGN